MIPAVGLGTTFFKCIAKNDYGQQNATVAVTISNSCKLTGSPTHVIQYTFLISADPQYHNQDEL